jgi:hypothetical protein
MDQRHLINPKGGYFNILNTNTGVFMLGVSTTQETVAKEWCRRYVQMYPSFTFTIVRTNELKTCPIPGTD